MKSIPIWIDCDTGVDDALALLVACRLEQLQIVGISTVSGNVHLDRSTENTLKVLELAGAEIPVYRGAEKPLYLPYEDASEFHGPDGLGGAELPPAQTRPKELPAWDALYACAKEWNGELTVVTIGPMTNLATALLRYPDLKRHIKQVVIMGGTTGKGNCTPYAEYNIYADPHGAQAVCASGLPLVFCPLDVTHQAFLTEGDLETVAAGGTAVGRFVRESSTNLLALNLKAGLPGIAQHDVCPILYLAEPALFSGSAAAVWVETEDKLTIGKTYADFAAEEKNALILRQLDYPAFLKKVTSTLLTY